MILGIALFWVAAAATTPQPSELKKDEVLATVNGVAIHRSDLEKALDERARQSYVEAFDDLHDLEHSAARDYAGRQAIEREAAEQHVPVDVIYDRILQHEYAHFDPNLRNRIEQQRERIFTAERSTLDELIQKVLLEQAAKAKGMTVEELNRSLANQVPPPTKAEVDFIKAYESSKAHASEAAPPGDARLAEAIREARVAQMKQSLIDAARASAKIDSHLEPPRVALSTAGAPLLGSSNAPVKVVVFTDFECPYCKEAEGTLARLRQQYGDRVAIYYRNYPLPNHLYAKPAAVAAVCAAEQGKYERFHDLLFAHSEELAHPDFALWGEMAGLDRARFEACRASEAPARQVEHDIRDGIAYGVVGTPAFFVNGRAVRDEATLRALVAEEAKK